MTGFLLTILIICGVFYFLGYRKVEDFLSAFVTITLYTAAFLFTCLWVLWVPLIILFLFLLAGLISTL